MTKDLKKEIGYVVMCVNEFAKKYGFALPEGFDFLFQFGGIQFLKENYEVEHLLALDDVLEDLATICRKNGGKI